MHYRPFVSERKDECINGAIQVSTKQEDSCKSTLQVSQIPVASNTKQSNVQVRNKDTGDNSDIRHAPSKICVVSAPNDEPLDARKPMKKPLCKKITNVPYYRAPVIQKKKGKENVANNSCQECGKVYAHYASLYKHQKKAHYIVSKGHIKCHEKSCLFTCHYLNQFRDHLTSVHKIMMEKEVLTFKTYQGTIATYH